MSRWAWLLCATALGCGADDPPALSKNDAAAPSTTSATGAAVVSSTAEPELPSPDTPIVNMGGVTTLPGPLGDGPKLAARHLVTRIYVEPRYGKKELGYLRAGAIVEAADRKTLSASKRCEKGWRKIKPAGFVCLDSVTSNLDDVAGARHLAPPRSRTSAAVYVRHGDARRSDLQPDPDRGRSRELRAQPEAASAEVAPRQK